MCIWSATLWRGVVSHVVAVGWMCECAVVACVRNYSVRMRDQMAWIWPHVKLDERRVRGKEQVRSG